MKDVRFHPRGETSADSHPWVHVPAARCAQGFGRPMTRPMQRTDPRSKVGVQSVSVRTCVAKMFFECTHA